MARKYQYNISIAYLQIENWQELSFHFSGKILTDISKALAIIINESLDEEDYSGVISAGEYLFLCPHQSPEQVLAKFTAIKQAIKTRFFANLGDYSVKIRFSIDSPNIQDIDPYVFLSRLSECTVAE
jgi:GGDEF domain-containing protein